MSNDKSKIESSSDNYDRIAIITGATSGIGEATARKLVNSGIGVIGSGRNQEKLNILENELGNAFHGVTGDITDKLVQDELFARAIKHFGQEATIVIANAGRGLGGPVSSTDIAKFEELIQINILGAFSLMQKAAQKMLDNLKQRPYPDFAADIVVIGSLVGRNISPFSAVYGSTKFAVHSLAEALRREIGPKGIRVTLVEPGITISGFQKAAGYSDKMVNEFDEKFGPIIVGEDVALAIDFMLRQPPHVHISDIVVRPTRQDYP